MKLVPQPFLAPHAPSNPFPFISFADPAFQLLSFHIVAKIVEGRTPSPLFSPPLLPHSFRVKSNHCHSYEKTPGVGAPPSRHTSRTNLACPGSARTQSSRPAPHSAAPSLPPRSLNFPFSNRKAPVSCIPLPISPIFAPQTSRTRSIDAAARGVLPIIAGNFGDFAQRQKGAMAQEAKHLQVTLESQVESVNLAEEMCLRVAEAAGFGEDDCYRIGMSVREGVINAFHYGNQERPEKKIHLAVDLTGDKMIIHVLDEGSGFRLSDVPDPLAEENLLSTSGRGIFLMRAFMDEFDVVRGWTGGAEIVMSKKLPSSGPESNGGGNSSHGAAPRKEA